MHSLPPWHTASVQFSTLAPSLLPVLHSWGMDLRACIWACTGVLCWLASVQLCLPAHCLPAHASQLLLHAVQLLVSCLCEMLSCTLFSCISPHLEPPFHLEPMQDIINNTASPDCTPGYPWVRANPSMVTMGESCSPAGPSPAGPSPACCTLGQGFEERRSSH